MADDREQCKSMREKNWSERSTEEKLEALKSEVLRLVRICHELSIQSTDMSEHRHLDDRIMVPHDRSRDHYTTRTRRVHSLENHNDS